jgi:hypothetical protein
MQGHYYCSQLDTLIQPLPDSDVIEDLLFLSDELFFYYRSLGFIPFTDFSRYNFQFVLCKRLESNILEICNRYNISHGHFISS